MATKIKETPVLYGKDAERFDRACKENEAGLHKVSSGEYQRAMDVYNSVTFVD